MTLPFEGAISAIFETEVPEDVRAAIKNGTKKDILDDAYPYADAMPGDEYDAAMDALQLNLVRLHYDVKETGKRLCVVFEG
ncbi:MAG: polyphosphate kinase 2, partial [Rhodobacterales bacterium]|nr:polyphosphate kinase 2 [Rhodobacterales bacterium]